MLGISGQLANPAVTLGSAQKRKRGEAGDAEGSPRLQFRTKTAHCRRLPLPQPLQAARLFAQGHLLLLREGRLTLAGDVSSSEGLNEVAIGHYEEPSLSLSALLHSRDGVGKLAVSCRSE